MKKLQFDRLGVFTYSQEENTPAGEMAGQIDEEEKEFRKDAVLNVQSSISLDLNQKRIGRVYEVLVEGKDTQTGAYYGRSYAEAPDVDGKIFIETQQELEEGKYYNVRITRAYSYDCVGELER